MIYFSQEFKKAYQSLNKTDQKKVDEKLQLFVQNPHHPSLRTKKIQSLEFIWETSISTKIRFTWSYFQNGVLLRTIGYHDIL
jgi:mRNA-degrading endonuclease RelE of RelBE toxin-antitoxin system